MTIIAISKFHARNHQGKQNKRGRKNIEKNKKEQNKQDSITYYLLVTVNKLNLFFGGWKKITSLFKYMLIEINSYLMSYSIFFFWMYTSGWLEEGLAFVVE